MASANPLLTPRLARPSGSYDQASMYTTPSMRIEPEFVPAEPLRLLPFPQEIMAVVMDHLDTRDHVTAARVNSAFYVAAKPRLFGEVVLDEHFHIVGPGHAMVDLYDGTRPVFLRGWMTANTTVLDVEKHTPLLCNASLPALPRVRTVRMPLDVHDDLRPGFTPSPCGVHTLTPRHLVHKDVIFDLPAEPTTTSFTSLLQYTAIAAPKHKKRPRYWEPMLPSIVAALTPDSKITLVFPPHVMKLYGDRLSMPLPNYECGGISAYFDAMSVAKVLKGRPHLIGFESMGRIQSDLCASFSLPRDQLPDEHNTQDVFSNGLNNRIKAELEGRFTMETYQSFFTSEAGRGTLSPAMRKEDKSGEALLPLLNQGWGDLLMNFLEDFPRLHSLRNQGM